MLQPYWVLSLVGVVFGYFSQRMFNVGFLPFRSSIKGGIGCFFVRKKNDIIRLIVDSEVASFCHRTPPHRCFGSSIAISELDLCPDSFAGVGVLAELDVRTSAVDLHDSFYQFCVPEFVCCFGVSEKVDAYSFDCRSIW